MLAAISGAAPLPGENVLEDLQYRVDVLGWTEAMRAGIVLKSLGPGRYQAEVTGELKGILAPLSGHRQDTYYTEMVWREGLLKPTVYREECRRKGKRHLKEYRFDYRRGILEMWQLKGAKGLVRKWQCALKGPVYDPISAFYNCRLGLLGSLAPGETLKVTGIPYPKPEEYQVRLGSQTQEGGEAMVSITNEAFENKQGVVFVSFDGGKVPTRAWTRILGFGKVVAQLLPQGKSMKGWLPGVPTTDAGGQSRSGGAATAVTECIDRQRAMALLSDFWWPPPPPALLQPGGGL
jgi:hypothetical protein